MFCGACGARVRAGTRYCGMCGTRLAPAPAQNESERRRVTTVFVDLVSFSKLTRGLDPEELRDIASDALSVVAGVIEAHGGYVSSLQGDGLMAFFGAPSSHSDDEFRAVTAAAASLEAIKGVGAARGLPLEGRAGVDTGVVIAGSMGAGSLRRYTVMGSSVNLASRLEEAANPSEVLVGPETYRATRHGLRYLSTGALEIAGFPDVKRAHRLLLTSQYEPPDPYLHVPFVGREEELAWLHRAFDYSVRERAVSELWVHGPPGSGKTRLLREFANSAKGRAASYWLKARPNEQFSWVPLGRQVFGIRSGEETRVARRRAQRVLNRLLPQQRALHTVILASMALLPGEGVSSRRVEGQGFPHAWRELMRNLPGEGTEAARLEAVVLLIENEPQDEELEEFLALLTQSPTPLLLVRTSRRPLSAEGGESRELRPLNREESLGLLQEMVSADNLPVAANLTEQVGGIPAHLVELGRSLSLTRPAPVTRSLTGLMQARLDLLDDTTRHLLSHTALAGEVTWEGLLFELGGPTAADGIQTLAREAFLIPQPSSAIHGEAELRFQSELVREAAMAQVPYAERPHIHLRIAKWLEQYAPLAFSELTAAQFELGGLADAAYAHYLAAADMGLARREADATLRIYQHILELELPLATRAEAALSYAHAALRLGQLQRARTALELAAHLVGESGLPLQSLVEELSVELQRASLNVAGAT